MRHKGTILFTALMSSLLAIAIWFVSFNQTKVLGELSRTDLREISRLIHKDLRRFELPRLSEQNLHNPRYVLSSLRQYAGRRILWVDVQDMRTVRAFVGDSKEKITADGWSYLLIKDPGWRIGATSYWGSAELAPHDLRIPAGL